MNWEDVAKGGSDAEEREGPKCAPEIFDPTDPNNWEKIRGDIVAMEQDEWEEEGFDDTLLTADFNNPQNVAVILRDIATGQVVGFTYAEPLLGLTVASNVREGIEREDSGEYTAYISDTLIHPMYRGRHFVGGMMRTLEEGLRARGFKFIERDVSLKDGYADNVIKNNQGRIIFLGEVEDTEEYGPERFIRMSIQEKTTA